MAPSKNPLSPRRDEIFRPLERPQFLLNEQRWPDFYALLEVPRGASERELNDAIIEAASQLFAVNFARGMNNRLRLIERFTPDFRLVLLNPNCRERYDALLERHTQSDKTAMNYADFFAGEWGESLLQRARRKARTLGERVVATWRDAPYI